MENNKTENTSESYIQVQNFILKLDLTLSECIFLSYVFNLKKINKNTNFTYSYISELFCISQRTIQRNVTNLNKIGYISIKKVGNKNEIILNEKVYTKFLQLEKENKSFIKLEFSTLRNETFNLDLTDKLILGYFISIYLYQKEVIIKTNIEISNFLHIGNTTKVSKAINKLFNNNLIGKGKEGNVNYIFIQENNLVEFKSNCKKIINNSTPSTIGKDIFNKINKGQSTQLVSPAQNTKVTNNNTPDTPNKLSNIVSNKEIIQSSINVSNKKDNALKTLKMDNKEMELTTEQYNRIKEINGTKKTSTPTKEIKTETKVEPTKVNPATNENMVAKNIPSEVIDQFKNKIDRLPFKDEYKLYIVSSLHRANLLNPMYPINDLNDIIETFEGMTTENTNGELTRVLIGYMKGEINQLVGIDKIKEIYDAVAIS